MKRPVVLVSACLLGVNCRYAGDGKRLENLDALLAAAQVVPVCPEILGGMATPRAPSERRGVCVVNSAGEDVSACFARGAEETLRLARLFGAKLALLKERSPSCGAGMIYDGSFSGHLIAGNGVTAEKLLAGGIRVYGESRLDEILKELRETRDNDTIQQ